MQMCVSASLFSDFYKGISILFQGISRLASLCGLKLLSLCLQKWNYRVDKKAVCHRQDASLSSDIKRKQQIQLDAHLSYNEDIDDA